MEGKEHRRVAAKASTVREVIINSMLILTMHLAADSLRYTNGNDTNGAELVDFDNTLNGG